MPRTQNTWLKKCSFSFPEANISTWPDAPVLNSVLDFDEEISPLLALKVFLLPRVTDSLWSLGGNAQLLKGSPEMFLTTSGLLFYYYYYFFNERKKKPHTHIIFEGTPPVARSFSLDLVGNEPRWKRTRAEWILWISPLLNVATEGSKLNWSYNGFPKTPPLPSCYPTFQLCRL